MTRGTAPTHLRPATRRWYASVVRTYCLEPHHTMALQAAAEAWDRTQEARERLAADGAYVDGRYGLAAWPVTRDLTILATLSRALSVGSPARLRG